jgi:hypothetical protein
MASSGLADLGPRSAGALCSDGAVACGSAARGVPVVRGGPEAVAPSSELVVVAFSPAGSKLCAGTTSQFPTDNSSVRIGRHKMMLLQPAFWQAWRWSRRKTGVASSPLRKWFQSKCRTLSSWGRAAQKLPATSSPGNFGAASRRIPPGNGRDPVHDAVPQITRAAQERDVTKGPLPSKG